MKPAGYAKIIQQHNLAVIPNWHESNITTGQASRLEAPNGQVREFFPAAYDPGDELTAQLEFALKYDGINLLILSKLFAVVPQETIGTYILSKPTGKFVRRIWYLYEMMTASRLPIEDLTQGNYVDLLDPDEYFTSLGKAVQRQRIRDNLLGNARFCPTIRRTQRIAQFEQSDLAKRCRQIMEDYPLELLKRALSYLYTKESKSSFEIEHIKPTATRIERFVSLLQSAETEDFFHKAALIELQIRLCVHAPFRRWQRKNPSLPDPQYSIPARLHPRRHHVPGFSRDVEKKGRVRCFVGSVLQTAHAADRLHARRPRPHEGG